MLKKVALEDRDMGQVVIAEVMTNNPITMIESAPIKDVLSTMHTNGFRHLPIENTTGKVVGLVSMADVLQYAKVSILAMWCARRRKKFKISGNPLRTTHPGRLLALPSVRNTVIPCFVSILLVHWVVFRRLIFTV